MTEGWPCRVCEREMPEEFLSNGRRKTRCRDCDAAYMREYRKQNGIHISTNEYSEAMNVLRDRHRDEFEQILVDIRSRRSSF